MKLKWDELRFSTGISEVDDQHKALFKGINDFMEEVNKGGGSNNRTTRQGMVKMLNFLGDYVVEHFKSEEEYMERYSSPLKEKNKAEHEKFVRKFLAIKAHVEEKGLNRGQIIKLEGFLCGWLINHIEKVDKSLYDVRPVEEYAVHPQEKEKKPKGFFSNLWRAVIGKYFEKH